METVSYMAEVLQLELEELISNSTSKADLLLDPHEPACHCASGWEHGENYISWMTSSHIATTAISTAITTT